MEDNKWVDMIIDKIASALTKVDKSIQKSIELWGELTKDIYDDQPTHVTTGQPNNGRSGEEDSVQDKSVAEVKERPIKHWAMCFRKAKKVPSQHTAMCLGEPKVSPSQHWAMCASKFPESLIREQGDDDYYANVCDNDDYYDAEEEKEEEKLVEESSKDIWELYLRTSTTSYRPHFNHHYKEEASVSLKQGSILKWKDGYELLKDVDTPSEKKVESWNDDYDDDKEEDETTVYESCENMWETKSREHLWKIYKLGRPLGSCYLPPIHPLHEENNTLYEKMGNPYQLSKNDDMSYKKADDTWDHEDDDEEEEEEASDSESCGKMSEFSLKTSVTSYIPSQYQHYRNEEDQGWSSRGRSGYELFKNDEKDGDSWDNEEGVMEWILKHAIMSAVSCESLVGHADEDEYTLQGFVNVKEEEILDNSEFEEVETLSPECDWVYVTRD